jgi:hypothetical protein
MLLLKHHRVWTYASQFDGLTAQLLEGSRLLRDISVQRLTEMEVKFLVHCV